jgi:hypothetical protein
LCFPAVFFQGLLEFHSWISLAIAWGHFTISFWIDLKFQIWM